MLVLFLLFQFSSRCFAAEPDAGIEGFQKEQPKHRLFRCDHFAVCIQYWHCREIHQWISNDKDDRKTKLAQRSYCGEDKPDQPWVCCHEIIHYKKERPLISSTSEKLPMLFCGWSNLNLITAQARKYFDEYEKSVESHAGEHCRGQTLRPPWLEEHKDSNSGNAETSDNDGETEASEKIIYSEIQKLNAESVEDSREKRSRTKRMVGGMQSRLGQWPWVAALFYGYTGKHYGASPAYGCIGNIINSRFLLTTASCCTKEHASFPIYAGLGDFDFHGGPWRETKSQVVNGFRYNETHKPQLVRIKKIHMHPKHVPYNSFDKSTLLNDIALLEVKPRIIYNSLVQPVCLVNFHNTPEEIYKITRFQNFTLVSYGYSRYRFSPYRRRGQLRHTLAPILTNSKCYLNHTHVMDLVCLAGVKNMLGCNVDGGAPMMLQSGDGRYFVGGLALEFGPEHKPGAGCPSGDHPIIFTSLWNYIEWIASVIDE